MQPGWYSHFQNPGAVAYFDGNTWGSLRDGFALSPEVQKIIRPLQPGHPGPPAPFETTTVSAPQKRKTKSTRLARGEPQTVSTSREPPIASAPRQPKPGTGWWWGIGGGAALILCGIISGFTPSGANCGSPFKKSSVAEYMDALSLDNGLGFTSYAAECRSDIAAATVWVWVLILIGVLVALASAIIMAVLRSGQTSRHTAAPTTAAQLEDLARLRDKGLVSPEEFELKKQEFLRRF